MTGWNFKQQQIYFASGEGGERSVCNPDSTGETSRRLSHAVCWLKTMAECGKVPVSGFKVVFFFLPLKFNTALFHSTKKKRETEDYEKANSTNLWCIFVLLFRFYYAMVKV